MYYTLVYNGVYDYDGELIQLEDYDYEICEDKFDVVSYYYEKEYGKRYTGITCGEEEFNFVKDIENRWLFNEIDTWELYNRDYAFKDWLYDAYLYAAIESYIEEVGWESLIDYEEDEEEEDEWDWQDWRKTITLQRFG